MPKARRIKLSSPFGNAIEFRRMVAHEELGRLFEYKLDLLSDDEQIAFEDILGQNVTVTLELRKGKARHFNGYVTRFRQVGRLGRNAVYQATLRPWLWFLTRSADCRIFQGKTVPDILKEVFREYGFTDFDDSLLSSYRTWDYCVQYRETDFNFVSRLMEQEGIYYYCKHEEGKHTLVLADSYGSHDLIPGYEQIPYFPPSENVIREEHISDWAMAHDLQPGVYALNDFDFTKPDVRLDVKSPAVPRKHIKADYEIYDYPGEYEQAKPDGEGYAKVRIQELETQFERLEAEGNARGAMVGGLFKLKGYPRGDQNREYLITSAVHELEEPEYETGVGQGGPVYTCRFACIQSRQPYRSPRVTPKPAVQGPQTAIIVGKAGEEIWTDKHGRVKVLFHWDRYGKKDENASCWIRVSHPWAGKNWGAVAIPRIGQEVIVDFLEGDPDRPIITGRVYNAINTHPYGLPAGAMVSGFKSNSTPGGGGSNEISADDTKGKEKITIHAQYDMNTTVEHDRTTAVNTGNDTLTVKAGTRTVTVKGDTSLTVQAGNRIVNVTGDYKLDTTNEIKMQAPAKITLTCGGSSITMVPGKITVTAGPGASLTLDANALLKSTPGSEVLLDANAKMTSTGTSQVLLDANATMSSPAQATVQAPTSTLAGAGGSVEAAAAGVTAAGGKVDIAGGTVNVSGGLVKIN